MVYINNLFTEISVLTKKKKLHTANSSLPYIEIASFLCQLQGSYLTRPRLLLSLPRMTAHSQPKIKLPKQHLPSSGVYLDAAAQQKLP